MEVCHVRTASCDILQKQCNSILIRFASGRLDLASGRSSQKSFPRSDGNLELSELLDIVRTCYQVVRTSCRDWTSSGSVALSSRRIAETSQTMSTSENKLLVEYWLTEGPDGVALTSGRLQCFICKTLRGVRTPSKARPDGCTGTGWSDLKIAWNLHGYLLRNLWPYTWHEMGHCPYYLNTLNRTDNPVKKQLLHKVIFCQPECCQYKILTLRTGKKFNFYLTLVTLHCIGQSLGRKHH